MARIRAHTTCPCGTFIFAWVKKPTLFENTFVKLHCDCGSRILLTLVRNKGGPERTFTTFIDILELSKTATNIVGAKLKTKTLKAMDQVKQAVGIQPKASDNFEIETDMDEVEHS